MQIDLEVEKIGTLSQEDRDNVRWMDEEIENIPSNKLLYKCLCFFLRKKKLTYQDMYIVYCQIYGKKENYKKIAIEKLQEIYYFNNGKFPIKK